jgi:sugar O-acyltransferase (sialic acid O-acetyltransferase NeuD family)
MDMKKKLIIIGNGATAEVVYELFKEDSEYTPIAFAVEKPFITERIKLGLPVISLDELVEKYSPNDHHIYCAISFTKLNRLRARLAKKMEGLGYTLASYISSKSTISTSASIGNHALIFEGNNIQAHSKIGDNVILWSGNHVGHHSIIDNNCFISSHVVISGFCHIGENSFLGVNSTLGDTVKIGVDNWIGPGVILTTNTKDGEIYTLEKILPSTVTTKRFFKL